MGPASHSGTHSLSLSHSLGAMEPLWRFAPWGSSALVGKRPPGDSNGEVAATTLVHRLAHRILNDIDHLPFYLGGLLRWDPSANAHMRMAASLPPTYSADDEYAHDACTYCTCHAHVAHAHADYACRASSNVTYPLLATSAGGGRVQQQAAHTLSSGASPTPERQCAAC